jgi:hypothetical protein
MRQTSQRHRSFVRVAGTLFYCCRVFDVINNTQSIDEIGSRRLDRNNFSPSGRIGPTIQSTSVLRARTLETTFTLEIHLYSQDSSQEHPNCRRQEEKCPLSCMKTRPLFLLLPLHISSRLRLPRHHLAWTFSNTKTDLSIFNLASGDFVILRGKHACTIVQLLTALTPPYLGTLVVLVGQASVQRWAPAACRKAHGNHPQVSLQVDPL